MKKNINLGSNSGNIVIGGILTECNEFSINLMTQENFDRYEYLEGNKILELKKGVVDHLEHNEKLIEDFCSPGETFKPKSRSGSGRYC